jgi:hypothetical protein
MGLTRLGALKATGRAAPGERRKLGTDTPAAERTAWEVAMFPGTPRRAWPSTGPGKSGHGPRERGLVLMKCHVTPARRVSGTRRCRLIGRLHRLKR